MKRGSVVRSKAGRDKGKTAVILSFDDRFAYIADGKERKVSKPKLKNVKHLELTETVLDEYYILFDSRLRKKLNSINDNY